ncbi:GyrI-like domain-containing protein [Oceanospirillum sp. D5]|uniref:GyrI-like domain-containing protein n=2 Tax=Oceanospirillum sediminis TaxID=2760088 RepID=A0A839IRS3_9GAMM|nr:GyrI-like domain-containing protein [Oceanospirillum sediminis]MBB1487621.1 GyrI-like domain-containing protein [Oceanospirillum sediminis]
MADIACISPYHLHRIYNAIFGESLVSTVKRLRLHKAAGYLANSDLAVKDIAVRSGYSSLQSFSRAFSEAYGMPPARYRREGSHKQFSMTLMPSLAEESSMHDVRVENIPGINLMGLEHKGDYMDIGQSFEKLFGWLGMRGLANAEMRCIGIYFDDPDAVPKEELRSAACAGFPALEQTTPESPYSKVDVQGGEYAILRFKGPYANMHSAYQWFYGQWLPQSGREACDQPVFEEYLNNPREVAPDDLITDIYMPLKPL